MQNNSVFIRRWVRRGVSLSVLVLAGAVTSQGAHRFNMPSAANQPWFTLGSSAYAQEAYNWAQIEQDIITAQNQVRQDPASLIPLLEERLANMDDEGSILNGCGPNCHLQTQEGKPAVQEAIDFLRQQAAVSTLEASPNVAQAAKAHAQDQANGRMGHDGSDGSTAAQRIDRTGALNVSSGENIAYGPSTGQQVVLDLIVDDGVADRGHRTNIFDPSWTHTGAGCGPHAEYRTVCVINYIRFTTKFNVVNNGSVNLEAVTLGGINILGDALAPGETREITLSEDQCQGSLGLQMSGYLPASMASSMVCGSTLTVNPNNGFRLSS
ncbi:MAG: CAP domain-containing protein [Leptolyngbya sp. DLM2.Bin15]|nr:MAG: CAP domain-containing protein [Leptolyngbya sp. DLM2.Bin15]